MKKISNRAPGRGDSQRAGTDPRGASEGATRKDSCERKAAPKEGGRLRRL